MFPVYLLCMTILPKCPSVWEVCSPPTPFTGSQELSNCHNLPLDRKRNLITIISQIQYSRKTNKQNTDHRKLCHTQKIGQKASMTIWGYKKTKMLPMGFYYLIQYVPDLQHSQQEDTQRAYSFRGNTGVHLNQVNIRKVQHHLIYPQQTWQVLN